MLDLSGMGCFQGGVEVCRSPYCEAQECFDRRRAEYDARTLEIAREWAELLKADDGQYEIRSRSECGGVLVLYLRTSESPTGVLAQGSIPDNRQTRDILYQATTIYMGAY